MKQKMSRLHRERESLKYKNSTEVVLDFPEGELIHEVSTIINNWGMVSKRVFFAR